MGAGEPMLSCRITSWSRASANSPAGTVRTFRFETRATASGRRRADRCAHWRCSIRRRSPACAPQPIESQLNRGAARYGRSQFTFTPRFDVLKTELSPADESALRALINSWRGARDITIRAVGHADSQPIAGRNRKVFADNYALSQARAQTVAELPRDLAERSGSAACTSRATARTSR